MNKSKTVITSNLKANPYLLLLIWIFLVILPMILLLIGGNIIIEETDFYHKESAKLKIVQEFHAFKTDLTHTAFVENIIQKHKNILIEPTNAKKVSDDFFKTTQIPISLLINFNSETDSSDMYLDPSLLNHLNPIPKTISKEILKHHGDASFLTVETSIVKSPAFIRAASHLKNILKTPGNIELIPNRPTPFISAVTQLGKIIITYIPGTKNTNETHGGTLVIIREKDIPVKRIMQFGISKSLNDNIIRSYELVKNPEIYFKNTQEAEHSFKEDSRTISLLGFPSDEFTLRLITKGTFYPLQVEKINKKFIFLKVTANSDALEHPLKQFIETAKMPGLALFCLATIILLNLHLFGYASSLNIFARVMMSIFTASLLPFSIFASALIFEQEYSKLYRTVEMKNVGNLQANLLSKALQSFIESKESAIAKITEEISSLSFEETVEYFNKRIKSLGAISVLLMSDNQERSIVYNKENQDEVIIYDEKNNALYNSRSLSRNLLNNKTKIDNRLQGMERESQKLLYPVLKKALRSIPLNSKMRSETGKSIVNIELSNFSAVFESSGKMIIADNSSLSRVYSYLPLLDKDKENNNNISLKNYAAITFNTIDLLDEFLSISPQYTETFEKNNFKIQHCFIPIEKRNELPNQANFRIPKGAKIESLQPLFENMVKTMSNNSLYTSKSFINTNIFSRLNLLIITLIENKQKTEEKLQKEFLLVSVYFILATLSIVYFLKRFLIKPVKTLIAGARNIEQGNYNTFITYESGDEFENLVDIFNDMSKGLRQKEKMMKYLPTDLLEELNTDSSLIPGGERINASILFCSLHGLKNLTNTDEIGKLIDIADDIATKNNGQIDKLIGKTLMIVFRDKNTDLNYAYSACKTALEISKAYNDSKFKIQIGLASGDVVSGKIGSLHGKLDFTVIGNPVNLASRIKAFAKQAKSTGIVICPNTIRILKGKCQINFITRTQIKGRTRTFPIYELLSLRT